MFIYVIVCSETLKIYVGQHKGTNLRQYLQQKWYEAEHRLAARSHLYAAMRKHSRESWSIHPLVSDLQTRAECDHWERLLIKNLNAQNPEVGYNICRGGEGFTGEFTKESRQKMSASHKKEWASRSPEKREAARVGSVNSGRAAKANGTGIHAMTHEQHQAIGHLSGKLNGAANGRRAIETGHIYRIGRLPQAKEAQRRAGLAHVASGQLDRIRKLPQAAAARQKVAETARANKTGIFAPENLGKGGRAAYAKGAGWFGRTAEQHTADSKKAGHVRWHVKKNALNPACALCLGEK